MRLHSRTARRLAAAAAMLAVPAGAAEAPLPLRWDVETGENVRWVADLGSYSYGGPVVAAGKVLVGTNNTRPRDPIVTGDRGVLMAFRAEDGAFLWQATHEKLEQALDFPLQGVCSTPRVEGDRVYYVSNRGELMALDTEGFLDGENDGPETGEPRRSPIDADVVWRLDLRAELGVVPHYMSASTPAILGDLLFVHTSNGIDEAGLVPAPQAPSFLAVDRWTGAVRWSDASPGTGLVDGQWSSPTVLEAGGRRQVLFPGGDGWLYSFAPASGELLWKLDGGAVAAAGAGSPRPRNAFVATALFAEDTVYIPAGRDPEQGSGPGVLWALDPALGAGADPGERARWSFGSAAGREGAGPGAERGSGPAPKTGAFSRAIATVAVADGIVYAADLDGFVVALEAASGRELWRHDMLAPVWASPLVAQGRVYVSDTDGDVTVLAAGPRLEVLAEMTMDAPIHRAPVAADGVLYLMTAERLYALAGARAASAPAERRSESGEPAWSRRAMR
ncbi:MAG TPA: PQQ-binding-like beta-propeller repeat protein [Thermoanaerobaculia bacterium]|nr:PQQ-binding-like beta-propeller repeat protein [Thermoanaerobaculia bacterium]